MEILEDLDLGVTQPKEGQKRNKVGKIRNCKEKERIRIK